MSDLFGAFDEDMEEEIIENRESNKKSNFPEENINIISKKRKRDKNMGLEIKQKKKKIE